MTYKLAERDKRGLFMGKKDKDADGLVKTLKTFAIVKNQMEKQKSNRRSFGDNMSNYSGSRHSAYSRRSKTSRASKRSNDSMRSKALSNRSKTRRGSFRGKLTAGADDQSGLQISKAQSMNKTTIARVNALKHIIGELTDKRGEEKRSLDRLESDPLDLAIKRRETNKILTDQEKAFLNQF